ncbi:MAG: hypothetical protein IID15_01010 [Candidatus Marinimicrobia bacterium]|nr:hypothetical protein [Candidatus Neomarinimicrobiota bacterium]
MKCTLYILKCLRTGNQSMGVTTDLRSRLSDLFSQDSPNRIANPEILHLEHFETIHEGHRRLQSIKSRWDMGKDNSTAGGPVGN